MSYVVYVTVILPVILLLILGIRAVTLEGAGTGIKQYLTGDPDDKDPWAKLKEGTIWAEGIGQIFFSLSVCVGVMTSYGSGNKRDSPVVSNAIIISIVNSSISFCAGFVVWSIIGFLKEQNSPVADKSSSLGLAFIAYPTACA